ncbi:hypothetical protein ACHAW5_009889 [Stephanodiscus triporus]|uniref:Uncharacterized protein n=1 Tax=Stephanodiscus triporus TaxID=2934178 RepID=A0ABD3Q333_9STRA
MMAKSRPFLFAASLAIASFAPTNHAFSPPSVALASPAPSSTLSLSSSEASDDGGPYHKVLNKSSPFLGGGGIRGDRYGASNNSTILTPAEAAASAGVEPAIEATKETWQRAWRFHRFMMTKVLHRFDGCRPTDSKLSLACLWWKALAGNDISSPVYDYQLSYDLLPPVTRWIVSRRLCQWYPRLHHANVEIRTAYLDKSVISIMNTVGGRNDDATTITTNDDHATKNRPQKKSKIRLIVMGGGYDTRSMKLLERYHFMKNEEKNRNSLTPQRYNNLLHRKMHQQYHRQRRPWLKHMTTGTRGYPKLIPVDFNNVDETRRVLEGILLIPSAPNGNNAKDDYRDDVVGDTTNIILFEGVMIYLDEGIPHALLRLCSDVLSENSNPSMGDGATSLSSSSGYLCFADRLENIPGGDFDAAQVELESTGWELLDWLPKPGLARHMGVARLRT